MGARIDRSGPSAGRPASCTDLAGSALDQVVGIELFARLDEIVEGRRAELRPRRDALLAALAAQLPEWQVPVPAGGLSVWAELAAPLASALTVAAAQYGVIWSRAPDSGSMARSNGFCDCRSHCLSRGWRRR